VSREKKRRDVSREKKKRRDVSREKKRRVKNIVPKSSSISLTLQGAMKKRIEAKI